MIISCTCSLHTINLCPCQVHAISKRFKNISFTALKFWTGGNNKQVIYFIWDKEIVRSQGQCLQCNANLKCLDKKSVKSLKSS